MSDSWKTDPERWPEAILELRSYVEKLALGLKNEAQCNTDCIFNLSQRLNKLETRQKPGQDSLVGRVAYTLAGDSAITWKLEARAAIREVAMWLEEEFGPQIDWITTELREEADNG